MKSVLFSGNIAHKCNPIYIRFKIQLRDEAHLPINAVGCLIPNVRHEVFILYEFISDLIVSLFCSSL